MAGEVQVFLLALLASGAVSSLIGKDELQDNIMAAEVESPEMKMERLEDKIKKLQEENDNLRSATLEANRKLEITDRQMRNGSTFRPADCTDILLAGITQSGTYLIYPFECSCTTPLYIYCDMDTDGGGWTVIMKRERGSDITTRDWNHQVNFNQSWEIYKQGFGTVSGEYYLGNENLYRLTNSRSYTFRMDMHTTSGEDRSLVYDKFIVQNEANRYRVTFGTRTSESSTRYDCYFYNRGRSFSTYDRDHDSSSTYNCASLRGSGWWWYDCRLSYPPTGLFANGTMNNTCYYERERYELTKLQIKIRPTLCDSTYKKIVKANSCHDDSECRGQ